MIFGILAGFGAAITATFSYVLSRHFVTRLGRNSVQLLVLAHLWMALVSLAILPFVFMQPLDGWNTVALPLLGAAGCYVLGQAAFFWTLKQIAASRLSPMLGLKIVFMAIFAVTLFGRTLNAMQWLAVVCATLAALLLAQFGEALKPRVIVGICATVTGYALSDLHIPLLIETFDPLSGMKATMLSVVLDYIFCGLVVVPVAIRMRRLTARDWGDALPFAVVWYISMCFFFAAIALVGVVLAVILQSTRGILSIGVGRWLSGTRHTALEQTFERGMLARQMAAALLMCIAIALFVVYG